MMRLSRSVAAVAMAATCFLGLSAAYAAQPEAWVKVELRFKAGVKTTTVFIDLPSLHVEDIPQYCERDMSAGIGTVAFAVQQGHPELANARFAGAKCVTEGGKFKWAKKPTDLMPRVQPPPPPLADPAKATGSQPVTYMVDLLYEKIVDGVRPKKYVRVPMQAANAQAAESMCGGFQNMLRLSRNVLEKNPYALGLKGNWMAGGGKCVTGKDGYIEMTVATSSGRSK